jgi:hypothetical protein
VRAHTGLAASAALVTLAAGLRGEDGAASTATSAAACSSARVEYTRYPGGDARLGGLPWIRGEPRGTGLVGLLWYWPRSWHERRVRRARIYTGGVAPEGYSTKILWAFVGRSARGRGGSLLVVRGERLDGSGSFRQEFAAISYSGQNGAPSYASIVDVPSAGCWRLRLSTGSLRASVVLQAVQGAEQPSLCTAGDVEALARRFAEAFNRGDLGELDAIFAREPEFEWYSTGGPGERLLPIAADRDSLVPYFRERHARGEQLTLRSLRFNGNTTGSRTYGNFEYTLMRQAHDLAPTAYRGKGAALCFRGRSDAIIVWSMAPAAP